MQTLKPQDHKTPLEFVCRFLARMEVDDAWPWQIICYTQGLLETGLLFLNHGQVSKTAPEPEAFSPNFHTSPREDESGASSGVVHVTLPWFKITWSVTKSSRVAEQCDVNIQSINQFGTSSSPVPLKTHRVGQRCTLNLSRAKPSSRWCGVVVRRGWCQLRCRPRHLTMVQNYVVRHQKPSCERVRRTDVVDRIHLSAPLHVRTVPARTIRRRLQQSGLSERRPLLGLPLTQNHRRLRRQWCDERRMWVAE
ncbi:uncharacterized protein TNCV_3400441 [Trichonephila clavipes]|nr:uncharacterized protein TNCV_3400441 [Trichonephila clavipes]